jgi:hypothetical protein
MLLVLPQSHGRSVWRAHSLHGPAWHSATQRCSPQSAPHPPPPHAREMGTNCAALPLIPTVNGYTVRSFSTHGQQSAAKGSSATETHALTSD